MSLWSNTIGKHVENLQYFAVDHHLDDMKEFVDAQADLIYAYRGSYAKNEVLRSIVTEYLKQITLTTRTYILRIEEASR